MNPDWIGQITRRTVNISQYAAHIKIDQITDNVAAGMDQRKNQPRQQNRQPKIASVKKQIHKQTAKNQFFGKRRQANGWKTDQDTDDRAAAHGVNDGLIIGRLHLMIDQPVEITQNDLTSYNCQIAAENRFGMGKKTLRAMIKMVVATIQSLSPGNNQSEKS